MVFDSFLISHKLRSSVCDERPLRAKSGRLSLALPWNGQAKIDFAILGLLVRSPHLERYARASRCRPRNLPTSEGERNKRFPIEAHPVTGTHRSDCHALLQDQRVLDVSIKPKSVRLQVRTIWAGGKQMNRDVMSAVASHGKIKRLCQTRYLHE